MSRIKSSDITLNGVAFTIFRNGKQPGVAAGTFGPVDAGVEAPTREIPIIMQDFSGGMGVCREIESAPNTYAFGIDVCTRYGGVVLPAGKRTAITTTTWAAGGKLVASLWFNGDLYLFTQRYILKRTGGTGSLSQVADLGTTVRITSATVYNRQIVVGTEEQDGSLWRSGLLRASSDGTTFSTGTMRARLLAVVYWVVGGIGKTRLIATTSGTLAQDGTGQAYYAHSYVRSIFDATVTTETNWTAPIKIGDASYDIVSIAAANKKVWFVKTEGICDVDQRGYSPNLTPQWKRKWKSTNGITSIYHDGYVWASHHQGLDRIDTDSRVRDDDPSWCQPGYGLSNYSPIYGQIQHLTTDDGWLVAAVYNGTDSYVMYGKDRRRLSGVQGPTEVVWHGAECVIRGEQITYLEVVSPPSAQPYMLIGTLSSGSFKLYSLSLPNAANAVQEIIANLLYGPSYVHEFASSFKLFLSTRYWGDTSARKIVRSFDFMTDFLNNLTTSGTNVKAFANADGGFAIWNDEPLRRTSVTPPESGTWAVSFEGYVDEDQYPAAIDAPDWDEFVSSASYRTTYEDTVQAAIDAAIAAAGVSLTVTVEAKVVNATPVLVLSTGDTEAAVSSEDANVLWDYQGTVTNSPREVFLPSAALETGYQISICLTGEGTASAPALIYSTKIRAEVIVDQLEIKTYRLIIGDSASMASGARDRGDTQENWARLWTLQNRGPVDLTDEWEEEVQAKVEPPISYEEENSPDGKGIVLVATVKMSILRRGGYWETGFSWGDPLVWS